MFRHGSVVPHIFNCSNKMEWMVSFIHLLLYPWYLLGGGWTPELVWTQLREKLCLCWESNPSHPACGQSLSWLNYPGSSSCLYILFEFRLDIFEGCSSSWGLEKYNFNSYALFQACSYYVVYYSLLRFKFLVYVTKYFWHRCLDYISQLFPHENKSVF
jgi:hypothetical protein